MNRRIPATSTIRAGWLRGHPFPLTTDVDDRVAEFDAWLEQHDQQLRDEIAAAALLQSPAVDGWGDCVARFRNFRADDAPTDHDRMFWEAGFRQGVEAVTAAVTARAAAAPLGQEPPR